MELWFQIPAYIYNRKVINLMQFKLKKKKENTSMPCSLRTTIYLQSNYGEQHSLLQFEKQNLEK